MIKKSKWLYKIYNIVVNNEIKKNNLLIWNSKNKTLTIKF